MVQDTQDHLAAIFKDFHTVICCTGMTASPDTQLKIARAALLAGVTRYFPWQFGIDYDKIGRNSSQDLFDGQINVRDLLRSQTKTEWVIVATGMFIPFLFEPSFDIVNAERSVITAIGSWDNALTVTDPVDIGRVIAEITLACPGVKGIVYVPGDTITMQGLADVVDKVMHRKVVRRLKTVKDLQEELTQDPSDGMRKYRVVFAEGVGVAWSKQTSFNERRGLIMKAVEQWVHQNLVQ